MSENKSHWYDGYFYDVFIAPNQDRAYKVIRELIEENSSLLDAGCGTGRLSFQMSDKCSKVNGIDLSAKNIGTANNKLLEKKTNNVSFYHSGIREFLDNNKSFDYSVLSYVIHEVDEEKRSEILKQLAEHSQHVIIIDYLVPRSFSFWCFLNEIVEFAAGKDHYKNFKSYVEKGGIKGLAQQTGLEIVREVTDSPSTAHITILKKKS